MDRVRGQPWQVFDAPLAGINLIEASAGTGKTRAITDLYLRMIIETAWQVPQILVVTFTRAATAELRDRMRTRLVLARQAFATEKSLDPFCQKLLERYPSRSKVIQRLDRALHGFDEAAISTIHGFCQRVLAEVAFESARPFEHELLPDDGALVQDIVDDFWRRQVYQASPLFVQALLAARYTPETLCALVRPYLGKPYLRLVTPGQGETGPAGQDIEALEQAFGQAYATVRALWQSDQSVVVETLLNSPALNRNRYRRGSIPGWVTGMTECLTLESPNGSLFDNFHRFSAQQLSEAVKKGHQPPQHPFFTACAELLAVHEQLSAAAVRRLHGLVIALLNYARGELAERKRHRQLQSYDDLLLNLEQALHDRQGDALAAAVRQRYPVVLIDEFQDTDPVQYRIFQRVYHGTSTAVFLVGDPKQAIYSFRGADIFAYLRACHDADQRYTLDINWRSEPRLIKAVNALFARARLPFLFEDLAFAPVEPASEPREVFLKQGQCISPLCVWWLGDGSAGQALTKGMAGELAAQVTATEIVRLLQGGARGQHRIGGRPLEGGDIAVLVRSHYQAWQVQEQLRQRDVPSVQLGQDNVFCSEEAADLERVLLAVMEPTHEARLRGALATVMLGTTGEELWALSQDESGWEARLEAFLEYQRLWRERGFARMFRMLLLRERVPQRLLQFQDGERRMTNLWHLAELLQTAADRECTGMEGLLVWLAERRRSEASADEEAQLRLESDEHLVKIVTIHKSKGLEYPVVFCPFLWNGGLWSDRAKALLCHDPAHDDQAVLDLGSEALEVWRPQACREEVAENLRLLYVALTRAKSRCYLVWGKINELGTSPLAWVLHQPQAVETPLTIEGVATYVEARSAADLRADLDSWAAYARCHRHRPASNRHRRVVCANGAR